MSVNWTQLLQFAGAYNVGLALGVDDNREARAKPDYKTKAVVGALGLMYLRASGNPEAHRVSIAFGMATKILAVSLYLKNPKLVKLNHAGWVMLGDALFAAAFGVFLARTSSK